MKAEVVGDIRFFWLHGQEKYVVKILATGGSGRRKE